MPEESFIESLRRRVEEQYAEVPTGCGGDFGEILCWELHSNGLTFVWLAEKWSIPVAVLGELIADHCKRLEPLLVVKHSPRAVSHNASTSDDCQCQPAC